MFDQFDHKNNRYYLQLMCLGNRFASRFKSPTKTALFLRHTAAITRTIRAIQRFLFVFGLSALSI